MMNDPHPYNIRRPYKSEKYLLESSNAEFTIPAKGKLEYTFHNNVIFLPTSFHINHDSAHIVQVLSMTLGNRVAMTVGGNGKVGIPGEIFCVRKKASSMQPEIEYFSLTVATSSRVTIYNSSETAVRCIPFFKGVAHFEF